MIINTVVNRNCCKGMLNTHFIKALYANRMYNKRGVRYGKLRKKRFHFENISKDLVVVSVVN